MPDDPDLEPIQHFPELVGEWCRDINSANRELVADSLRTSWPFAQATSFATMPLVRLSFRLYMAVEGKRVLFFFIRKTGSKLLRLDARIKFEVITSEPVSIVDAQPKFQLGIPPLMVHPVTDALRARLTNNNPYASKERTMLIDLGHDEYLATIDPEDGFPNAPVYFTADGKTMRLRADSDNAPLPPFLKLIGRLRLWASDALSDKSTHVLADPPKPDDASDVKQLLYVFGEAYRYGWRALTPKPSSDPIIEPPPAKFALTTYGLDGYAANVVLRLDKTGRHIASNPNEPHFQMGLNVKIDVNERHPHPLATIRLSLPDFLVYGEMAQRFLDALEDNDRRGLKDIHEKLPAPYNDATVRDLSRYLRNNREHLAIFRIKRASNGDRADKDVVTTTGRLRDRQVRLIFSANFRVDTRQQRPVTYTSKNPKLLYVGPENGEQGRLGKRAISHLMKIVAALKQWQGWMA